MASVFDPDAVLLDLTLPDMCGLMVAQQLRAAHAKLRIVIVTGWFVPDIVARVLAAGADAYRLKPVDIDEIVQLIHAPNTPPDEKDRGLLSDAPLSGV